MNLKSGTQSCQTCGGSGPNEARSLSRHGFDNCPAAELDNGPAQLLHQTYCG